MATSGPLLGVTRHGAVFRDRDAQGRTRSGRSYNPEYTIWAKLADLRKRMMILGFLKLLRRHGCRTASDINNLCHQLNASPAKDLDSDLEADATSVASTDVYDARDDDDDEDSGWGSGVPYSPSAPFPRDDEEAPTSPEEACLRSLPFVPQEKDL